MTIIFLLTAVFPGIPIVAVDISDNMNDGVNSYMDVLGQSLTILMRKTTNEEGQAADILLRPDVSGIGTLDNVDPEKVIALGVDATLPMIDEIKALSEKGPALFTLKEEERTLSDIVGDIEVHGLPPKMAELVRKRALRWVGKPVDQKKIKDGLDRLSESVGIEMADYQLGRTESGDILVRIDVRKSPKLKAGISGYTTNLHPNRWLYLKGEMNGLLSEYDSLIGVAKIGKQWGVDLTYQTAPQPMDGWQFTLSAQNWQPAGEEDHLRDWDRYAIGAARLFTLGDVNMGLGYAYEHVDGDAISTKDDTDMPSDPTRGYAWKVNAWWPDFDEVNYRLSYFKPLEVSSLWRTYLRLGFAEGDMNKRSHAVYLGAAEEMYSVAANPIEAERMFWANLAFRKIFSRTAMGVLAGELFGSWGYAMDKEWHKIEAPWEVGFAVNFPNNLIDMKLAIMYGSGITTLCHNFL